MNKLYSHEHNLTIFADVDKNQHIKKIYGFCPKKIDPEVDTSNILTDGLIHYGNYYDNNEPQFHRVFAVQIDGLKDKVVLCDSFQRNLLVKTEILGLYVGDDTAVDISKFIKSNRPDLWPQIKDDMIGRLISENHDEFCSKMSILLDE